MGDLRIRPATLADLPAINDIYNHYVLHSTCTYQTEPETAEARRVWFEKHGPKHPVIVAELADAPGKVIGWGSLSAFHVRAAYANTVENSIYVHHDQRRQGVGGLLLSHLIDLAKQIGHHTIIASIDAEQAASIALHERHGFVKAAHLKEVGFKFGRWLDVVYMQLRW
jgi:phosphinothricin acetyltransferase